MNISRHAEVGLIALTTRMPIPASVIIKRLREEPAPAGSTAIEVCRLQYRVRGSGTNGDRVVVIVIEGVVVTAYLRRSTQEFSPRALRVDSVVRWEN